MTVNASAVQCSVSGIQQYMHLSLPVWFARLAFYFFISVHLVIQLLKMALPIGYCIPMLDTLAFNMQRLLLFSISLLMLMSLGEIMASNDTPFPVTGVDLTAYKFTLTV